MADATTNSTESIGGMERVTIKVLPLNVTAAGQPLAARSLRGLTA
jgi:hypothetical protein